MNKTLRLARGIMGNWMAMAAGMAISFFLSPFIVHRLGTVAYGVWALVIALSSYMKLLDLGLYGSVQRIVSREHVRGNHSASSEAVGTAFLIRVWISCPIVLLGAVGAWILPRLFHIPPALAAPARMAVILTTINIAVNLTMGVFSGVLSALQRYDVMSGYAVLQNLLRATGVWWALTHHYGIVALAIVELGAGLVASVGQVVSALRLYPELEVRYKLGNRDLLREIWTYSYLVVIINVGGQLIYYSDNLVVGGFLSAAAVALYAIGGNLVEYLRAIVFSMTTTFTPLASSLEATGDFVRLRKLLVQGTQATMLLTLPISVALFFRGPTFIGLWMGPQYAQPSGHVLQILLIASITMLANTTGGGLMFGMSKHRAQAYWVAGEAAGNLVLSIILVQRIGLLGVAWGTTIPALIFNLFFRPQYTCDLVGQKVGAFFWQSWIRPLIAAVPFAIACFVEDRRWVATDLFRFFLQIAAILPIFAAGTLLVFWKESRQFPGYWKNPFRARPKAETGTS